MPAQRILIEAVVEIPSDPWRSRNQGFYVARDLATLIASGIPVLLAYDFSSEPARLAALQETVPAIDGVEEGASVTKLLHRLLD